MITDVGRLSPRLAELEPELVFVVLIVFFAALTRTTFGFGEALVAMPLLSLVVDVKVAAALIALTSIINAISIIATDRQNRIEWSATWRLVLACLIGIPIGVYGLTRVPVNAVKVVLACVVISFALYTLFRPRLRHLQSDSLAFVFGLVSGVLGGAYNVLGPPIVIFATLRGWEPQRFRITMQSVFLPASLFVGLNHYLHGLWTRPVFEFLAFSVPSLLLAALVGRWLSARFQSQQFTKYVCCLLLLAGAMLVVSVIWSKPAESNPHVTAAAASPADTRTDRGSAGLRAA